MPLYNVTLTLETEIIVVADDEDHAYQIALENARDAINNDSPNPNVSVRGEVTNEKHLRDGWDARCVPYGGDGNTMISALLPHNEKSNPRAVASRVD